MLDILAKQKAQVLLKRSSLWYERKNKVKCDFKGFNLSNWEKISLDPDKIRILYWTC